MNRWLKAGLIGGIIGLLIGALASYLMLVSASINVTAAAKVGIVILSSIIAIMIYSCQFITQCAGEGCLICVFIGPLLFAAYGFLIGAGIALIYGKLKSKKR